MPENASSEPRAGTTGGAAPAAPRSAPPPAAARPLDGVVPPTEVGGRGGPDPTRYGDWEKNGRCIDF